jgi:RNA polymerase sigma-70 factor
MSRPRLDRARVAELYQASGAGRWGVSAEAFESRIDACVAHALDGGADSPADVNRILNGLHIEDLALAMACEAGQAVAWELFASQYRPVLQRAAAAIDPTGRAADLADGLFADLYGADVRDGERRSLFRYFHGRSRLGTWLRAVLAQRHIDRVRQDRRTESLDDHDSLPARGNGDAHPDHARFTAAMDGALRRAIDALPARDRLLLGCYYVQEMTLAAIGRMLKEHEATVSRHLTRIRRELRERVESELRRAHAMDDAAVAECFRAVSADAGPLDLRELLGPAAAPSSAPAGRKDPRPGRSST